MYNPIKITANIATYPPRKESLRRMLASIEGQFDEVRVCFNGWNQQDIVKFSSENNIRPILIDRDVADNGKFFYLDHIKEPEIFFTLDDDLIYPPDYVARTLAALKKYGCIVSYHGRQLLGEGHHYYKGHRAFKCLEHVQYDEMIDVAGTGVMAFNTEYFHPKGLAEAKDLRMSDLIFSLEAAKQEKQIGVISHPLNWIRHINNKETIYETESINGIRRQNEIADKIYRLNHDGTN